jgi:DNA-binding NtrC family response regulator
MSDDVIARCLAYDWPGNVRELENYVERWLALPAGSAEDPRGWDSGRVAAEAISGPREEYPSYEDFMTQREQEIIRWALRKSANNVSEAARLLRLPRTTLVSRLTKLFPGDAADRVGAEGPTADS